MEEGAWGKISSNNEALWMRRRCAKGYVVPAANHTGDYLL